jgi:hypothetical protein
LLGLELPLLHFLFLLPPPNFATWRNNYFQLLNVRGVNIVKHTEIQKAEPLVNKPSALDVEMAIEELKRQKLRAPDQFQQNLLTLEVGQFVPRSLSLLSVF